MNFKKYKFIIILALIIVISGCSSANSPLSNLKDSVNQAAALDRQAVTGIVGMNKTAQEEKKLFDQIIKLGDDGEPAKTEKLSDQAIDLAGQRKSKLSAVEALVKKSGHTMDSAQVYSAQISNKKVKRSAKNMMMASNQRFQAFEKWLETYAASIKEDKQLYIMLKDKSINTDQLEGQLEKVDHLYKTVAGTEKKLNKATENFNKMKSAFFELAE